MNRKLSCLLFLLPGCLFLNAQDKWDLRRCVEYAVQNNISVKQEDIRAQLSKLTYEQSNYSKYPSLNFSTSAGVNSGRSIDRTTNLFTTQNIFFNSYGLQANVDLFNFGSKRNTIAANRFAYEASVASIDKVKDDISLNVAGTYLQVLLNKEQLRIDSIKVQQTNAQMINTRKLVLAGSVPELNSLQLEAQLAQDSANLITAQGNIIKSLLLLKALLQLDAGTPFDVVTPPVELIPIDPISLLQPEDVYRLALENLPQQRANSLLLMSAKKNADAAKALMYPNISMGANVQTNYSNSKNQPLMIARIPHLDSVGYVKNTNVGVFKSDTVALYNFISDPYFNQFKNNLGRGIGLTLSIPLFNGLSARTNWQRAKLNTRTYELQQQQANLTLKQDIYNAYTDAVTSLETFSASNKTVATAEKAYDFAQKRWTAGLLNTLDLITTQNNVYTARQQRLLAQYNYVFKMKVLEFYRGQGLKL
jgi:outer membrane protein